MLTRRPHIVHFSGHGNDDHELIFEDERREAVSVSPEELQGMFELVPAEDRPRVVILSACYSEHQADAVAKIVDCTIGMSHDIRDSQSFAFSRGFYNALGEGLTIDRAVEAGRLAMTQEASELPKLHLRQGDSPPRVKLINDGPIDQFPTHMDRREQLECFRSMLGGEGPRMLVLTAEGTMGKSRLMRKSRSSSSDWSAQADELIGAGVTRVDREKVAAVLAELAGGTAPSTVARKVGVGYATVTRIGATGAYPHDKGIARCHRFASPQQ